MRRSYRDLIVSTPGISESISGMILFDETIRQRTGEGIPFAEALTQKGIIPGIKVDVGAKPLAGFPGEKVTEGLDGLRERLSNYFAMGARFAKGRAVLTIGEGNPEPRVHTGQCRRACPLCSAMPGNGSRPGRRARGAHGGHAYPGGPVASLRSRCCAAFFEELVAQRVLLEGLILKPNMVLPGLDCPIQESVDEVADATMHCLRRTVPAAVAGVAFLSGGQSGGLASERLNAMHLNHMARLPWAVGFSFGRAIQQPALSIWDGSPANSRAAQQALYHRAACNRAARFGEYTLQFESDAAQVLPPAIPEAVFAGVV